ncbi:uncharacterized protein LOC143041661 [Oratosquilla oratoria]|uniref:uncharacterized protein LOC143041661 n=1 Tax=Oratosquilla oratoria TaxID=337810 RepID=UPI003F7673C1
MNILQRFVNCQCCRDLLVVSVVSCRVLPWTLILKWTRWKSSCGQKSIQCMLETTREKKANFRRKCQAFTIQDDCLKYVHKPNRKDITEVRFLRVIKDRQYQLDIVLASHRGSGYSDESVALGGHVGREKVVDRIMQRYWWRKIVSDVNETIKTCLRCQKSSTVFKKVDSKLHSIPIKPQIMHQIGIDLCSLTNSSSDPPSPTSLSEQPSPIVQIIGVQQQEIIYKFNPITVATQRAICNNSSGRLIFKKKSGPSGKINKTFKNTSEPLAVKVIKGLSKTSLQFVSVGVPQSPDVDLNSCQDFFMLPDTLF